MKTKIKPQRVRLGDLENPVSPVFSEDTSSSVEAAIVIFIIVQIIDSKIRNIPSYESKCMLLNYMGVGA